MDRFKRHDLVFIAAPARRDLAAAVLGGAGRWPVEDVLRLVRDGYDGVQVPGIVRRQEEGGAWCAQPARSRAAPKDRLCIGLCAPCRRDGERLRAAATIPVSAVGEVRTPYQVACRNDVRPHRRLAVFDALDAALAQARRCGTACGVFGSAALELSCSLPFCHEASDLDLIVRCEGEGAAREFRRRLRGLERDSGVRIDAELELSDGSAVKLEEFCSASPRMLVKGIQGVRLLDRDEALAMNHRDSSNEERKASWK